MSKEEIDNLITIQKVDGALLTNSHGIYRITRKDIGLLKLHSGQIMIADPLVRYRAEDFARKALAVTVKPGIYSVEVYVADSGDDCFLAFAGIRFSDNAPVTFTPAKTAYDQEHKRRPPFRYVVEDCRTGFMDADVFHAICALPRYACVDNLLDFDDTEDEVFRCAVGNSEDGELTAALVTIRKSGVYYWYWGIDRNNEVCCLIADFFTYQ